MPRVDTISIGAERYHDKATTETAKMRVAHGAEMAYASVGLKHRQGAPTFKLLLLGEEDTPGNFNLMLARQETFYSPRHHHNFEQFRFAYKGDITLGEGVDWLLRQGQLAYFPEGGWYGPQSDPDGPKEVVVLQFGGPSRQGYLSFEQLRKIQEEMTAKGSGTFQGGKFTPAGEGNGKQPIDGYEALWQHQNGRPMQYPVPRYRHPLLVDPAAFDWRQSDLEGNNHAWIKALGTFSDGTVAANHWRIDSDGCLKLAGRKAIQLLFFVNGRAEVGGQICREQSAVQLHPGEEAVIAAGAGGFEILHFTLPEF